MRVLIAALAFSSAIASEVTAPPPELFRGWLEMYDLKFREAHSAFAQWEKVHPADALGPVSGAAAYLFSELARLGALESELFINDQRFEKRTRLQPDPAVQSAFERDIARAEQLADHSLRSDASNPTALFAKALCFGLRADFAGLIEKQDLTALHFSKQGSVYADKLLAIEPDAYDAYVGPGIENYLVSLRAPPVRLFLRITGAKADRKKGLNELRAAAEHGHYLAPFAKLLLTVAALRDNDRARAGDLLNDLHHQFPDNPLYERELNRLSAPAK